MLKFKKKLREKKEASRGIAKAGFTLIELIVVIAILGILVLLAAPRFLGYTKDANVSTMQADAKVLESAALVYNVEHDATWPTSGSKEIATITQGSKTFKVFAIDEAKIGNQIQSLKGDIDDYGIVKEEGSNEGSVYHLAGVEDRDGDKHFGIDLVDVASASDDTVTVTPVQ